VNSAEVTFDILNTSFFDPSQPGYSNAVFKAMLHEIGHTMGLAHMPLPNPPGHCGGQTPQQSIMNGQCGVNDYTNNNMPAGLTACDQSSVVTSQQYYRAPCPGSNCNEGGGDAFAADNCSYPGYGGCPNGYHNSIGCCQPDVPSPIVVDVDGSGIELTSVNDGVFFDFRGNGQQLKVSWTEANSTNAWLALDNNGNGTIDNALELFGNFTPQPYSEEKNGFIALSLYDKLGAGGNEDNRISPQDSIFSSLRLWTDENHNGISELPELKTLSHFGVESLSLDYKSSKRNDQHGNEFRYRAKVTDARHVKVSRWAWDVFLAH
jgi:hypothetical protein